MVGYSGLTNKKYLGHHYFKNKAPNPDPNCTHFYQHSVLLCLDQFCTSSTAQGSLGLLQPGSPNLAKLLLQTTSRAFRRHSQVHKIAVAPLLMPTVFISHFPLWGTLYQTCYLMEDWIILTHKLSGCLLRDKKDTA